MFLTVARDPVLLRKELQADLRHLCSPAPVEEEEARGFAAAPVNALILRLLPNWASVCTCRRYTDWATEMKPSKHCKRVSCSLQAGAALS